MYSGTWELGTPKGLRKTVLNSEVVLFFRSISMYWIGLGAEVAVPNSQVVHISQVVLKTGFTVFLCSTVFIADSHHKVGKNKNIFMFTSAGWQYLYFIEKAQIDWLIDWLINEQWIIQPHCSNQSRHISFHWSSFGVFCVPGQDTYTHRVRCIIETQMGHNYQFRGSVHHLAGWSSRKYLSLSFDLGH